MEMNASTKKIKKRKIFRKKISRKKKLKKKIMALLKTKVIIEKIQKQQLKMAETLK